MALEEAKKIYIAQDNSFYRNHYHRVLYALIGLIVFLILIIAIIFYQLMNRPQPQFNALAENGRRMLLFPYDQPNQLPGTIIRWASKAATVAYSFDFYNYARQTGAIRPYFTEAGWRDYSASLTSLISSVKQKQIFVNGVVSGTPVIVRQGDLPGSGYSWQIQIPFLVTYSGANIQTNRNYMVTLIIVKVPTHVNPAGIAIDQFVMR